MSGINDAFVSNMQNQGQGLQNQMTNLTEMLSKFISSNTASSSNSGLRSFIPYTVVSTPLKEPEQNPETSMDKVQKPSSESTAQSLIHFKPNPLPRDEDESKKRDTPVSPCSTVIEKQRGNLRTNALADSGASINLLPYSIYKQLGLGALRPTRMTLELANRSVTHPMGIAEDVVVRVDGFTFLADFVVVNFEPDPRVPIILGRPFLRTAKDLIDLYEEKLTLRVGSDELVFYAEKSEKSKNKQFAHAISIIDFSKDKPFSGSTTNHSDSLSPSSSSVKTMCINLEEFADEFTSSSDSLHHEFAEEIITLPSSWLVAWEYLSRMTLLCEISTSRSQENVHPSSIPVEDSEPVQEKIDIFLVPDDLIPPGV
ncbi:reverse transcriptase domain-containing protein [Tanacetum coccineum]